MRVVAVLVPAALFAILLGCSKPLPTEPGAASSTTGAASPSGSADDPKADVGQPLYASAPTPVYPPPVMAGADPLVIPNCTVQYEERQQLSAEVDGKIEVIATPMTLGADGVYTHKLPDGKEVRHNPAQFDLAKLPQNIVFNLRDIRENPSTPQKWLPYWKISEGDFVSKNQVLAMLDDQSVMAKKISAEKTIKSATEGKGAAQKGLKYCEEKLELNKTLMDKGSIVSKADYLNDLITWSRFLENLAQSDQTIAKAEGDLTEATVLLAKHQIRTGVDGIIRSIAKRPGEFVHAGEKIMDIQSTEKVRVEGSIDAQYRDRLNRHHKVSIEPAYPLAPAKSHTGHRAVDVAGVAVTGHTRTPLVVSVGLDGLALVWDPNLGNETNRALIAHNLPHPVPVRSVATTPPGSKSVLVITGADDGKVRIWDVTDAMHLPSTPVREPADIHTSAITAIAVSPNGKFAATAAGREIFIWDLDEGKKLYALPQEHRDTVTSLSFTPQTQLVTASKDRSLKVWRLGAEKAHVAKTIDHRSSTVDILGVSPDGGRVLFDQDKSRMDLVTLTDAQSIGQLMNVGPNVAFANLAIFAPDYETPGSRLPSEYTILTGGGEGDLKGGLQVWHAPRAGGRGSEVARLIPPGRASVTSAAFSPHKNQPFLVVGTDKGTVHVWLPPQATRRLEGTITNVESSDPRTINVRAEMTNKGLGLFDRSAATIIVDPVQK